MEKHTSGFLIAVEGIDGSGKTTLTRIIRDQLTSKGKDVFALPSGGINSSEIEAQLRKIVIAENSSITPNAETLIYFTSLAQKVDQYIIPALRKNRVVVVDRFSLSTFVFAHYMFKQERYFINCMLQFASQGIVPDFTFLCDLDESVAYSRLVCRGKELSRREKQGIPLMKVMREGYVKEISNFSKQFQTLRTDRISMEEMGECISVLEQYIK